MHVSSAEEMCSWVFRAWLCSCHRGWGCLPMALYLAVPWEDSLVETRRVSDTCIYIHVYMRNMMHVYMWVCLAQNRCKHLSDHHEIICHTVCMALLHFRHQSAQIAQLRRQRRVLRWHIRKGCRRRRLQQKIL